MQFINKYQVCYSFLFLERLWRDVFTGCTYLYYNLFYYMESIGLLEPHNDLHLWCLHYVYQPRIDAHLKMFAEGWNRKPISTAGHRTPAQMWFSRSIAQSDNCIAEEINSADLEVSTFTDFYFLVLHKMGITNP